MTSGSSRTASRIRIVSNLLQSGALVWEAHPGYAIVVALLTILQGIIPPLQLWLSKTVIDTVVSGVGKNAGEALVQVLLLVGAQVGLSFFISFLAMGQSTVSALLGELLRNRISLRVLKKASTLEVSFFENEQFYNTLQNAYQEASNRPLEIVTQFFSLIQAAITLFSVAYILWSFQWVILLVIMLSAGPALFIQNRYGFRNYAMLRERAPELRKQQYFGMILTSDCRHHEIEVTSHTDRCHAP